MKWNELLVVVSDSPVFTTGFVAAGEDIDQVRLQLSRWVADGRLLRLRRGVYCVTRPYRKLEPDPLAVASLLCRPSYVSLQSALAYHGLIPEFVPAVTCVTTSRPQQIVNDLGRFTYRHIKSAMFFGFEVVDLGQNQQAFIATPEKALLDLVYLTPGGDKVGYLAELRLQNTEVVHTSRLREYAQRSESAKLRRAAETICQILRRAAA